jgi:hypothetical protein
MGFARFFHRVYTAAGGTLSLSRDTLEKHLGGVTVGIRLDRSWTNDTNATWIAEMIVNLCARLYGELHLDGDESWVSSASAVARSINPKIAISQKEPTHRVIVGNATWGDDAIYVRSDGWVARVLATPALTAPGFGNPLAAAAAGALAVAELFRRVFHEHVPPLPFEDVSVSLLDYTDTAGKDEALSRVHLGEVALVGIGAVGNAAVWCLSRLHCIDGCISLIDSEKIDESNLQRYVLASDTDENTVKVELAAAALANTGAKLRAINKTLEHAANDGLAASVAVSVDNVEGRRIVQALLPHLAINGWTSDRGLGASWHPFADAGPCLACGYHPRGQAMGQFEIIAAAFGMNKDRVGQLWVTNAGLEKSDLEQVAAALHVKRSSLMTWRGRRIQDLYSGVRCGAVALDLSGVGRIEAVPLAHQSALAGILMAAELIKRTDASLQRRSQTEPYVVWDDVLHPAPKIWTQRRDRRRGCICGDAIYQARYTAKWSSDPKAT